MSSFRVFISSTFKNFEFERNYLTHNLYNSLDASCRQNGYAFHAIDLRWGISAEASVDNKSMKLCLDEIEKCQKTNIKPNFLIMLGDYYGWKPLPFVIEEKEAELLLSKMSKEDAGLFLRCYKLDTNAKEREYVLQGRQGELVDDSVWNGVEARLHDALENVARATLDKEKLDKYIYSATHQEIIKGFLKEDVIKEHTFVFVKEEGNIYNNEKDYLSAKELKEAVLSSLPEEQYAIYKGEEDFYLAVEKAHSFLGRTIDKQASQLKKEDKQALFFEGLMDNYIADTDLEDEIIGKIEEQKERKIIISAKKQAGKTSLLLSIHKRLEQSKNQKVYLWCANSDAEHLSALDLCRYIIKKITKGEKNPFLEYGNACYCLQTELSRMVDEQKYVFLIDSIEALADFDKIKDSFCDIALAKNVVFVLTASAQGVVSGDAQLTINSLSSEKKQMLFNSILESKGRLITEAQRAILTPMISSSEPLLVRLLAYKMAVAHSYDTVDPDISSIEEFVKKEIHLLSKPTMYGEILISRIMLFLAFSSYGISENELLGLLKSDNEVVAFLKTTAHWEFDEQVSIPKVILYRIMAELGAYVSEINSKGDIIYKFNSQHFADAVCEAYDDDTVKRLYEQYKAYFKKKNVYINSKKQIDTRIARHWIYVITKEDSELIDGLESYQFCDACIKLGEISYLINCFKRMNLTDSPLYKVIMKHLGQLLIFSDMFLTYATSENVVELKNYKKLSIQYGNTSLKQITNWASSDLVYYQMISENSYVIAYENEVVKIDSNVNEVTCKTSFNARVVKCCLCKDKSTLLVLTASEGYTSSAVNMHMINLSTWEEIESGERFISYDDKYLFGNGFSALAYKNGAIVIVQSHTTLSVLTPATNDVYYVTKDVCEKLFTFDALLANAIIISERYLLIKKGFVNYIIFDLEKREIINQGASTKCARIAIENTIVAEDGNAYFVHAEDGVYELSIKNDRLRMRKAVPLYFRDTNQSPRLCLLNKSFVVNPYTSDYADAYSYDGFYLGKFKWDGAGYIADILDDKIYCVDKGGRLTIKELDTSITFNQKKVKTTLVDFYKVYISVVRRIAKVFNRYEDMENTKKICAISPNGKYTASLTREGLVIRDGETVIFEYLYRSKRTNARDVCFVSDTLVLWKQSYRSFKAIDLEKRVMKNALTSFKKMDAYSVIDGDLLVTHESTINFNKQIKDTIKNAVTKKSLFDNSKSERINIKLENCFSTDIIKAKRKNNKEATIIFSLIVPSQLQLSTLLDDQILAISGDYVVRLINRKLFFYRSKNNESLKIACAFEKQGKQDKSKIATHDGIYYSYLEPLGLILIYDSNARQTISYLVDESVCDVAFEKNIIRVLHLNGTIDTIRID